VSNVNAPFGLRPVSRAGGAPFSVTEYGKLAADAQAIFVGDLVGRATGSVAMPELPTDLLPVIVGGYAVLTPGTSFYVGSSLAYGAASTASVHPVTDETDVIYLVQAKTGTTISTGSHAGRCGNYDTSVPGSTSTKQSGMAIDLSSLGTTKDLKVTDVSRIVPNAEGANAIVEVIINRHYYTAGVVSTSL
jgi:hypothetical protein